MASLKYCDKHNQVGFLKKPKESAGFAEIVDFLKGSHIRYALTHNPTIHDSLVKQFWHTATASTLADGTLELRATIDTIEYTITEASVRIAEPYTCTEPTTHPTSPSPEPDNEPTEHTFDQPSTEHQPLSPRQEPEAPQSQYPSHPHVPEARSLTAEDLLHMVPTLITKVDSLETELKQTKQTMGKAIVKLVKKNDPLVSFVTPTKPSGEAQEEEINPTTLEAAKTLSKVASQRSKLVDKGKRYKRRKEFKGKDFEDISTGFEEVNTGGLGFSTGSGPVSSE
ncbi:hypothetical protein Tco_0245661 [Tanacetum coccineum]